MKVNPPPIGSGAYFRLDRTSLRKQGLKYSEVEIKLTDLQLYIILCHATKREISLEDLWTAFGTRKITKVLSKWFDECIEKVRQHE